MYTVLINVKSHVKHVRCSVRSGWNRAYAFSAPSSHSLPILQSTIFLHNIQYLKALMVKKPSGKPRTSKTNPAIHMFLVPQK